MKNPINFFEGHMEGEELWFSNLNFNALMKMNIDTGETEMIDLFPGFPKEQENLHLRVMKYEDCLYFMPFVSNVIHIWNLSKMVWEESITLLYPDHEGIAAAVQLDHEVWIFRNFIRDTIIKVDLCNRTVVPMIELSEQIQSVYPENSRFQMPAISTCEEGMILSAFESDTIIIVDLEKEKVIKKYVLENVSILGLKERDPENCLLWFGDSSEIWNYCYADGKITKVKTNIDFPDNRYPFYNMVHLDENRFLVLPWQVDQFVSVDFADGVIAEVKMPPGFKRCNSWVLLPFSKQIQDKMYLFPRGGNQLVVMQMEDLSTFAVDFVLKEELHTYIDEILEQQFVSNFCSGKLNETNGGEGAIQAFLDLVCKGKQTDLKMDKKDAGSCIHNEIKHMVYQ